jgi:predicted nuclease of predicted toxin-antitoxin system
MSLHRTLRFLLDESADARLATSLRRWGHDVAVVAVDHPASLTDREVLAVANGDGRILITDDRDIGELVFRWRQPHAGVIYLRLGEDAELVTNVERLEHVLTYHADEVNQFLVVSLHRIRVRRA